MPTKLTPTIDSDWWVIAPRPSLSGIVKTDETHEHAFHRGLEMEHNAPVDHHIYQDTHGTYHLWACVRATARGRVLYHWRSNDVRRSPWEATGESVFADHDAGECVGELDGQEWLQSPFIVRDGGLFYMYYGGHRAGIDTFGAPVVLSESSDVLVETDPSLYQMCLMTSADGLSWERNRNLDGTSRVFLGPGEVRDPCVLKIGDEWCMYYAGYFDPSRPDDGAGFVVRTSRDLVKWSPWRMVHRDPSFGAGRFATECPFVTYREGYYYLFRTVSYYKAITFVFRSEDPFDFGIGDASEKLVCRLECAAPELYTFDGIDYLSSSHAPLVGEQMCTLAWVES